MEGSAQISDFVEMLKTHLESLLNSNRFSTDSIEGWLCILLLGFTVWNIGRKAMKFAAWSCCVIFLAQVGYWLSQTSFNNIVPVGDFIKLDVMTSIAQCFVGTRACDLLLTANSWIRVITLQAWAFLSNGSLETMIQQAMQQVPL